MINFINLKSASESKFYCVITEGIQLFNTMDLSD
jgi:hypothetical protein